MYPWLTKLGVCRFKRRQRFGSCEPLEARCLLAAVVAENPVPPVAVDDNYETIEDRVLSAAFGNGVLTNDSDADGDRLKAVVVDLPSHGTLDFRSSGFFNYVPDQDFYGTDTFTYTANDTQVSNLATVTITIVGEFDPAVAQTDHYSVRNPSLSVSAESGVLANDLNPEIADLSAVLAEDVGNGSLVFNSDGSFVFQNEGFRGTTSFRYAVVDDQGVQNTATVTIEVDLTPIAKDDIYQVDEDAVLDLHTTDGILANDIDEQMDEIQLTLVDEVQHGSLIIQNNGAFRYTPDPDYFGPDGFTYFLNDGIEDSRIASVLFDVVSINDLPVVTGEQYFVLKNGLITVPAVEGVLANDSDIDGLMLTAILLTPPENGVLTLAADGSLSYRPNADFAGDDSFTYIVDDGIDQTEPVVVQLSVSAQQGVIITEFMARNRSSHRDEDGDFSDWLELYNPTDEPVNLGGAFLTDDASALTKWQLNNHVLLPGEYLVVFASGKDRSVEGSEFHTNFELDSDGEDVILVLADGLTISDSFMDYPEQKSDISFGRFSESDSSIELVSQRSSFRYLIPESSDADLDWTVVDFDDRHWLETVPTGVSPMVISEISIGEHKFIELQSASSTAIDTRGWSVLINDVSLGIDGVSEMTWSLPDVVAPGEVLYRTDDESDNYWGSPFTWNRGGPAWAMILDDLGRIQDFVVWGYSEAEIQSLNFDFGAFTGITIGNRWWGTAIENGEVNQTDQFYMDHVGGEATHANTNAYAGDFSFILMRDNVTGRPRAGLNVDQRNATFSNQSKSPAIGTDAHTIFDSWVDFSDGVSGSVELSGDSYQAHSFLNLNSNPREKRVYEFVGTAITGESDYENRWTLVQLLGVETAIPAHSAGEGVVVISPTEVAIWTGANHGEDQGYVARWVDIVLSEPDQFTVVAKQYQDVTPGVGTGLADGPLGYGLTAVRLTATDMSAETPLIHRTGTTNNRTALDFSFPEDSTLGQQNPDLQVPFVTELPAGLGIGYGTSQPEFDALIQADVTHNLRGINSSLWTRIEFKIFDVQEVEQFKNLLLGMKFDAGFRAFINGVHVAEFNAPENLNFNSAAVSERTDTEAVVFHNFDLSEVRNLLQQGTNVLAIQLLNSAADDSDLLLVPRLSGTVSRDQGHMSSATAGSENAGELLPAVSFSHDSGPFTEDFELAIEAERSGVEIRYTLDGKKPTLSSLLYDTPIAITESTEIRAQTFGSGNSAGQITTRAFTKIKGVLKGTPLEEFSSNLPVLVFDSFGTGLPGSKTFIDGQMFVLEPDDTGRTLLKGDANLTSRVFFRRRGSSTANNPKPNLRFEIRDELDNDRNVELLGLPSEADWVLYGPYNFDRALVRDPFMHELQRQAGDYSPRHRFVEVFGDFNGGSLEGSNEYLGVYVLTEQIQIGSDRVDIAELSPNHNEEPETTGGYIIKVDRSGEGGDTFSTTRGGTFVHVEPAVRDLTKDQKDYIRKYLRDTESAIYGSNPTDPVTGYPAFIDVQGWIDENIFRSLAKDPDGLVLSTYLHKDRQGKLSYGPIWDFDRTMGNDADDRALTPQGWTSGGTNFQQHHWWARLFNTSDFAQAWTDRWWELRKNVLTNENFAEIIDSQAAEISEAQARNFSRWPSVSPNGGQYSEGLSGWEGEISHLKGWLRERLKWIDSQTVSPVTIVTSEGLASDTMEVTLTASEDVIYYTLDGSDPRVTGENGGEVSSAAIEYSGDKIVLDTSVDLFARAFNSESSRVKINQWSAPAQQMIITDAVAADATNLRISEINYHPLGRVPQFGELASGDDEFEFLEFINVGDQTINLDGVQLVQTDLAEQVEGVSFAFNAQVLKPNERAVAVKNLDAFRSRYGHEVTILGGNEDAQLTNDVFSGRLANGGETITLVDAAGQIIQQFDYDDEGGWPGRADGRGSTLEVVDLTGDYSDPDNWRNSVDFGGSPGSVGSVESPPVVINEILANSELPQQDAIELANFSDHEIDLSGWYLSDSNNDYFKFQVPMGTTIPAGGYIIFDENDFNAGEGSQATDFLLNSLGDDVTLLAAQSGRPTHFVDRVEFDATQTDMSLGRMPNASANGRLIPQIRNTLGVANLGHHPGKVIISEVHYNPIAEDDAGLEFIELYNNTPGQIDLREWRVNGAVDYAFSDHFTEPVLLLAGETLVVVGFDPYENEAAAIFRTAYEIDESVTLVGPWQNAGALANGGERIDLQRAVDGADLDEDQLEYILIDQVDYEDDQLWPASADGQGDSLHRRGPVLIGNQADVWIGSVPTPGSTDFTSTVFGDFNGDRQIDDLDIDLLGAAVSSAQEIVNFDLNRDGQVTSSDFEHLVEQVMGTRFGDVDLDGDVDVHDLTAARIGFTGAQVVGGSWASGDNDGDGDVDTRDIVRALIRFSPNVGALLERWEVANSQRARRPATPEIHPARSSENRFDQSMDVQVANPLVQAAIFAGHGRSKCQLSSPIEEVIEMLAEELTSERCLD